MRRNFLFVFILLIVFSEKILSQTTLSGIIPCSQTLGISGSPYVATANITVSAGCVLNVNPGVEIRMGEGTHLIVKGSVNFLGTNVLPIHIHASDTTWGNILLDSTLAQKSVFDHVIIENARKSVRENEEPGAIYGYYSNFEIRNCYFNKNLRCVVGYKSPKFLIKNCILDSTNNGEKIHGQYCSGATVDGCTLYTTRGDNDEIDFDASNNIFITNNFLIAGGDDGMDIGQCDSVGCDTVTIRGNFIANMFNKGISNGEWCNNIIIDHNVIIGNAIGIGAKSGAHVKADHNTLYGNRCSLKSYDHVDQIWGPGHLVVSNCIVAATDTAWYVDPTSFLQISYSLADDTLVAGSNNIKGNPGFIAPGLTGNANFHLMSTSAAIDKGDPAYPMDPDGSRSDIGAFPFDHLAGIYYYSLQDGLILYPNPSDGIFIIDLSEKYVTLLRGKTQLKVYNEAGQVVYSENISGSLSNYKVDLCKQARGVYYLQIISEASVLSGKLILK